MKTATAKSAEQRDNKLRERCAVLVEVIRAIRPIYGRGTSNQKQLLETMIGAALWYFPCPRNLWTGKISIDAAKGINAGIPPTQDHHYPRKIAARELLVLDDSSLTSNGLYDIYVAKYGRFNFVTSAENRKLMRLQRADVFESPEHSYLTAGIELVDAAQLNIAIDRVQRTSKKQATV